MAREQSPVLILGIETSCDETAAAVVADGRVVHSNVVASQVELHARFGGVFPEVASRQHIRDIVPVVERALAEASVSWPALAALAVTMGPGLSGSLLVGVNAAKGMALAAGLPLYGASHLEGHLYANWLHEDGVLRVPGGKAAAARGGSADSPRDPPFPHLALVVSGGHTDLVLASGHGRYRLLGSTLDDAAGEAFDKVARILELGYPGGPAIEHAARAGDRCAYRLPVATTRSPLDFSFSGLKTAAARLVQDARDRGQTVPVADIAASFQEAVALALVGRTRLALAATDARAVLLAGGVSANTVLRARLAESIDVPLWVPPLELCTDNAAMIAAAAYWRMHGRPGAAPPTTTDWHGLDIDAGLSLGDDGDPDPDTWPAVPGVSAP